MGQNDGCGYGMQSTDNRISDLGTKPLIEWGGAMLGGLLFVALAGPPAWAVALDPSFAPSFTVPAEQGLDAAAALPGGEILVAGKFESLNGIRVHGIAKLDAHGNPSASFNPGMGVDGRVYALAVQPDDKILLAGQITKLGGRPQARLGRLNADGSLDTAFAPYVDGPHFTTVYAMAVQSDGRLVLAGDFTSVESFPRRGIARLLGDGQLDLSFDPQGGLDEEFAAVADLAIQPDGKLVIAGNFTTVDGVPRKGIARLLPDGRLDASFDPGDGAGGAFPVVSKLALQSDGKVIVAGGFRFMDGEERMGMARLNTDGSLDPTFVPSGGVGGNTEQILDIVPQPDGKIIVVGDFNTFNGLSRNGMARLDPDGALDTLWIATGLTRADGSSAWGNAVVLPENGQVVVVGSFDRANGTPRHHLARFKEDGSLDTDYSQVGSRCESGGSVNVLHLLTDGKLLAGGDFARVGGVARNGLTLLERDGTPASDFDPDAGFGGRVNALVEQADGKLLVGGFFESLGGKPRANVGRLGVDGHADESFDSSVGPDGEVYCLAVQAGGQVVVGGPFEVVGDKSRRRIARFHADGRLDADYMPSVAVTVDAAEVYALVAQKDDKTIVAGYFDRVNGEPRSNLARLNADGTLDSAFANDLRIEGDIPLVLAVIQQQDGKLLIGGSFTQVNGEPRRGLARLLPDGRLDAQFEPSPGIDGADVPAISSIQLLEEGQVMVGGDFTAFGLMPLGNLAWLSAKGGAIWDLGLLNGFNGPVNTMVRLDDHTLIVGGGFTCINGQPGLGLARFTIVPSPLGMLSVKRQAGTVEVSWEGTGALQAANFVAGPWFNISPPSNPFVLESVEEQKFFRLVR